MNKYINIQGSTGKLLETSKEQKEGYEPYQRKDGTTAYRRYLDEVQGILQSVSLRDSDYGKQISVHLRGINDFYLQIPFKGNYGVDKFAEDFITQMGSLNKGTEYRLKGYLIEKSEDNPYEKRGISIRKVENGEFVKIDRTITYNKKGESDPTKIPGIEKVTKMGEDTWNSDKKDEFLYQAVMRECERLKPITESPTRQEAQPQTVEDDLPF